MNVKSLYKKSIQRHTLLNDAVDIVAFEVEGTADAIIVGPPARGEESDVELNNDKDLTENNTLPDEVTGEIDIFEEGGEEEEEEEEEEKEA